MQHLDQKFNPRQNSTCLEQQINASPENFTVALIVILETLEGLEVSLLVVEGQIHTQINTYTNNATFRLFMYRADSVKTLVSLWLNQDPTYAA